MKGRERRNGSVSVLLTCLMAGLIPVFLLLYGNASFETLKSAAEWNSQNAGSAVLSHYLPQLSDRYDIYGIWNEESLLEWRMKQYMEESSPFWNGKRDSGLLKAQLEEMTVDPADHCLMDPLRWKEQIQTVMELGTAVELLERTELAESLREVISLAGEGLEKKENAGEIPAQRSGQRIAETSSEEGEDELNQQMERLSQEGKRREAEGKRLMDSVNLEGGGTLEDRERIQALPSRQIDLGSIESGWDALRRDFGQLGEVIRSSLDTDLYALRYFGNYRDQREGWFLCEVEYLLQGELSDEKNFKKTKQDLFFLRTALNLAALYRDETMRQWIGTMAAAAAPVPYPVAFGVIAASLSAAEAGSDVKRLLQGESIPVLKSSDQWMYEEGPAEDAENDPSEGLSYEDYLHILLLLRPQRTKLVRMMDLVQLNLSCELGPEFSLKECCTGFHWNVRARLEDSAGRGRTWEYEGDSAYE